MLNTFYRVGTELLTRVQKDYHCHHVIVKKSPTETHDDTLALDDDKHQTHKL